MSSLIEQAAKRLAQLRQAGAEIPAEVTKKEGEPEVERVEPFIAAPPEEVSAPETFQEPRVENASPAILRSKKAGPPPSSRRVKIDLNAVAEAGMVSPLAPRSAIAERYRVIKRPLLANAAGKGAAAPLANGNLIMVTSALPREGKTFTAINLAMSIATEMDHTVMLVDADVARPSLLETLGLPVGPGLLDVLQEGSVNISNVLLKTNVDKLTILPSGTPHPRATELLASDAMVRLLQNMAGRYKDRIIIFDSPPLLPTTESRVLASHMGQIAMVVEAERTLQSEVEQALSTIESCPVRLLILNKARAEFKKGYSYACGYAYGYG